MLCGRTGLTAPLWAAIICVAAAGAQGTRTRPGPQLPRDSLGSLRSGTAVLRGRVVDGLTGEGIPRARVRLLGNRNARVPVLTDAGGPSSSATSRAVSIRSGPRG
jgi:hypothetical protein